MMDEVGLHAEKALRNKRKENSSAFSLPYFLNSVLQRFHTNQKKTQKQKET